MIRHKTRVAAARILTTFVIMFAVVATVHANAQERYVDRLDIPALPTARATISLLMGIARAGESHIAVGEHGHILVSADQGKSWTQSEVPVSSPLVAVTFPTPQQGWAVGHDGVILYSADGGKHWERQLDGRQAGAIMVAWYEQHPRHNDSKWVKALDEAKRIAQDGASKPFLDVYFENAHSGWAIGSFNMILKTADGGKSWVPWLDRTENDNGYSLHAITAIDREIFIVGELGLIQRLDREQERFVAVPSPYHGSLFGVTGKPGVVMIYGLRGNLFRSRDQGKTWQALKQEMEAALVGGSFLGDGRLVLVSNDGRLMLSNNDGDSFTRVPFTKAGLLSAVVAAEDNSVIVVGARGVRRLTLP